ncbi:MAG: hypothetical protein OHK0056_32140 [Bacteriovoracaceae bacterium]
MPMTNCSERLILFYDGACALCHWAVVLLAKLDKENRLSFAPLQGSTAEKILDPKIIANLNTLVFIHQAGLAIKSNGIYHALIAINRLPLIILLLKILPSGFSDFIYDGIARVRKVFKTPQELCPLQNDPRFLP